MRNPRCSERPNKDKLYSTGHHVGGHDLEHQQTYFQYTSPKNEATVNDPKPRDGSRPLETFILSFPSQLLLSQEQNCVPLEIKLVGISLYFQPHLTLSVLSLPRERIIINVANNVYIFAPISFTAQIEINLRRKVFFP